MKTSRVISLMLILVLLCAGLCVPAAAAEETADDVSKPIPRVLPEERYMELRYRIEDNECMVNAYNKEADAWNREHPNDRREKLNACRFGVVASNYKPWNIRELLLGKFDSKDPDRLLQDTTFENRILAVHLLRICAPAELLSRVTEIEASLEDEMALAAAVNSEDPEMAALLDRVFYLSGFLTKHACSNIRLALYGGTMSSAAYVGIDYSEEEWQMDSQWYNWADDTWRWVVMPDGSAVLTGLSAERVGRCTVRHEDGRETSYDVFENVTIPDQVDGHPVVAIDIEETILSMDFQNSSFSAASPSDCMPNSVFIVLPGSFGETWCRDHGFRYSWIRKDE